MTQVRPARTIAPRQANNMPLATTSEMWAILICGYQGSSSGTVREGNKLATMDISHFNDLLAAARHQPDTQRLLLVFAGASLPADATPDQRRSFEAGESGELSPLMCVDKDPAALADFAALCDEAAAMGQPWVLVFAAALSGAGQHPLASSQIDSALQRMVESVKVGSLGGMIPFDRQGRAVQLG